MLAGVSGFEWAWIYYGHRPFARGNLQSLTLDLVTQVNQVRGKSLRSSHSDVAGRRRSVQPGRGRPIVRRAAVDDGLCAEIGGQSAECRVQSEWR
eukprot:COSAG06_NODE_6072_length_3092_cov_9.742980_1_plen_95_part_00